MHWLPLAVDSRTEGWPRSSESMYHWIGLRDNLQETMLFTTKYRGFYGFPVNCSLNQSNEWPFFPHLSKVEKPNHSTDGPWPSLSRASHEPPRMAAPLWVPYGRVGGVNVVCWFLNLATRNWLEYPIILPSKRKNLGLQAIITLGHQHGSLGEDKNWDGEKPKASQLRFQGLLHHYLRKLTCTSQRNHETMSPTIQAHLTPLHHPQKRGIPN